jgi:hypothetical protein
VGWRRNANALVVLLGAGLLNDRGGDTVEVTLAVNGDAATTTGSVLLEDTDLLEGLENLALDRAGGVGVVRGAVTAVGGTTVELLESTNTDVLACEKGGEGRGGEVSETKRREEKEGEGDERR